ncbi:MAG: orotidine 5'-phosphate decarboxylase / HUMPS family protein [Candidatus Dormibacteria bacterium]
MSETAGSGEASLEALVVSPEQLGSTGKVLLQFAVDDPVSLGVIGEVAEFVDIVEIGTPLLKRFGLAGVITVRELGEGRPVLADSKTVDAGATEARMLFGAGARFVSVLAGAAEATLEAVHRVAEEFDGYAVADTVASPGLPERPKMFPGRVAYLGLHLATDRRGEGGAIGDNIASVAPMHALGYRVAIAGGIDEASFAAVVEASPDVVVVGSAIAQAQNPRRMARWMSAQLTGRGQGWPPFWRFAP